MVSLSKYLAQSGVCSRRKGVELIVAGKVVVNGAIVNDPGCKVTGACVVQVNKRVIKPEQKVYLLLNKPEGYVTTHQDQAGKQTVMDLVQHAAHQRLHAVGRLDKNTTGLLVITNDGNLTQKLAHPTYQVQKTYIATLDKPLSVGDMMTIKKGVRLTDGVAVVDHIARVGVKKVKVTIHSGKYRIIRRLFKKLDYNVLMLDRVYYAGLSKKGLQKGHWRKLTAYEVKQLKELHRSTYTEKLNKKEGNYASKSNKKEHP